MANMKKVTAESIQFWTRSELIAETEIRYFSAENKIVEEKITREPSKRYSHVHFWVQEKIFGFQITVIESSGDQ